MTLFRESGKPSETLTLCEQEHRKSVYCTVLCLCHVSVSDILLFFYLGIGAGQLARDKSTCLDICTLEYRNSDIDEGNEESRNGNKLELFYIGIRDLVFFLEGGGITCSFSLKMDIFCDD